MIRFLRSFILAALFIVLGIFLFSIEPKRPIKVAVAKGGRLFNATAYLESVASQGKARDILESDPVIAKYLSDRDYGYLYAYPLTDFQERLSADYNCQVDDCLHITLYDYDGGGTIETNLNSATGQLFDLKIDPDARPGASPYVVPRARAIAANDDLVRRELGDVRENDPMMVPMSAWLADGSCAQNWCVDLTYMAPDGSGRILHIMVDMENEVVDRLFYSRGRPDREFKPPAAQGARFNDGCHEQYNWNVCWNMTANDGIEFYDASYDGDMVFSSAKIGQVEVYYPSWPGGYRDEIGYSASVHPYYGTNVADLGDGFEVRQLFTEFLRWPNCICCYRYEQIVRFFADGSFELDFISHGPGCDDLSTYRPFWRIDLDIIDEINDETWYWNGEAWEIAETETDIGLFEPLSPEGYKLFTASAGKGYLWSPMPTDPLGLDEGRLFIIRYDEGQGEGTITTGPALTFWPPAQWLDGERLSNENIVIWYIPILKTIQGEPWWCMPDPEPDFSPCNGSLLAEPLGVLPQSPTPTATPVTVPQETPTPEFTPTIAPTATPRPVAGDDAETIILNSGCGACHLIGELGEAGKVGPDLSNIGLVAQDRVPGLNAGEYLRQSILEPGVFIAPECPNGPCRDGIMPKDYAQRLSAEQVDILVEFLSKQILKSAMEEGDQQTKYSPTPTGEPPKFESDVKQSIVSINRILIILILAFGMVLLLLLLTRGVGSNTDNK